MSLQNSGVLGEPIDKRQYGGDGLKFVVIYAESIRRHRLFNDFKREVIDVAFRFWERALSVRRPPNRKLLAERGCVEQSFFRDLTTGKIFCKSQCKPKATCYNHPIPDEYASGCSVGSGVGSLREVYRDGSGFAPNQYVVFVSSVNEHGCLSGRTLAYAGACETHPTTDRPIMGMINFCPEKMDIEEPGRTMMVGTAIHEMAHALGFSKSNFPLMRDLNGRPLTPRDPKTGKPPLNPQRHDITVRRIGRPWHTAAGSFIKPVLAFVTPTLLDETMAGETGVKSVLSALTLAFFTDSGWWDVDYSVASEWHYGKDLGCNFVMGSCYAYMARMKQAGKSIEPYCDETGSLTCYHKKAFGICAMGKYKSLLPPEEQYFKGNPNVGGTSTLTDRCPTVQPMETFFKEPFMTYCDHRLNIPFAQRGNMFGQAFGNRSICIPHMGAWRAEMNGKLTQDPRVKATCHDVIF
ncbi:unnamed protein product [Schistosoma intercalatum]|nr:unnamed protein product [Schistosoma intercalatum]